MREYEKGHVLEWSFDLEEARYHLLAERDDLLTTIRGHLYVEHVFMEFLRVALANPDALDTDRIAFRMKLDLCAALGTLPQDLVPPIKILNRLRNGAAHKLTHVIPETAKREMFDSLPPIGRELVLSDQSLQDASVETIPLGRIFLVVLVLLDAQRHRYETWLNRKLELEENLREAVQNLRKSEGRD